MDPEVESQLNAQLAEMAELLRQQNSAMASQVKMLNDLVSTSNTQVTATKKQTQAENDASAAITGNTAKQAAASKSNQMIAEANQQLSESLKAGKDAILGFAGAMLDVSPGMSKYASSIKEGTDAVGSFTSSFGLLGKVTSGLLTMFSSVVTAGLKYNDAVVKGYDDVSKLGGAIGSSAEGILKLGHQAGLSSQNLEILTKNAAALGSNIKSLGNTTSQGVANFAKFIAVGDNNLQQYRKLGFSQERLTEVQEKYLDLQAKAGASLNQSPELLQKASLKYLDRLNVLSEVTGVSAEKQQGLLDQALAQENFNAYMSGLNADIEKAKREGNAAEADRLQKVYDAKTEYATMAAQFGPEKSKAILEAISTNGQMVVTKSTASLAMAMPEVADQLQQMNRGINQTPQLIEASNKSVENYRKQIGNSGVGMGETSRTLMGIMGQDNQSRQLYGRTMGKSAADIQKEIDNAKAEQIKKKNEQTGAMAERAKIESEERAARLKFDEILSTVSQKLTNMALSMMPKVNSGLEVLAKNLDTVGKVLKGIGIAFGVLAGAAVIGKVVQTFRSFTEIFSGLFGTKKGELGSSKGNPLVVKFSDGNNALTSLTGGGKSTSAMSGQGVTQDKSGKWRDAKGKFVKAPTSSSKSDKAIGNLNNLAAQPGGSQVGTFLEGLGNGLSFIGKNAVPVLEGAGVVSVAIVAIAAAVGLAGVALGKTLPYLASGLTSFDKVKGSNLEAVGKGMAGLGAGILAMGGEGVAKGFSAIANWLTGDKDKDPIKSLGDQLEEFQKIHANKDKVKYNAEAFAMFATAMSDASIAGAPGVIAQGIATGVSSFFENGEPPYARFKTFAELTVNPKKVQQNATAFKLFSEVMASYKGYGPLNALGAIGTALADHAFKFFKINPPIDQFVYFATQPIDPKKAKSNAAAFVDFANALANYKPAPGALEALSQWVGSKIMGQMFDPGGPIDNFDKFTRKNFGPNMEKNSAAFLKYAESQNKLGNTPGAGQGADNSGGSPMQSGYKAGQNAVNTVANTASTLWQGAVSLGSKAWNAITGGDANEKGVKPEVLGRKAALEKIMGRKLTVTSGVRAGAANHGDGSAIDLGLNTNNLTEGDRTKLMANAINLGFTGIGAEYRAPGGSHIHLDISHKSLTGWGSDYTHKSLMQDSPWLAQYIGSIKAGEHGGPLNNNNTTITSGKPAGSLKPGSALTHLAKTSTTSAKAKTGKAASQSQAPKTINTEMYARNMQLNKEILAKLDSVIDALENDHATQSKILRHSSV